MIFTFILPKAISYYRVVKTAIRTRPPPRPLPKKTGQGLNALFASICVFFYLSLPLRGSFEDHNVFVITQSRLTMPTDALFSRLAMLRDHGVLTSVDEALRSKLTSPTYVPLLFYPIPFPCPLSSFASLRRSTFQG
jgi:hypothetical protein